MSLKTKARIKQLQNINFRIPIGADGYLIDMASGLDLQQQLLLQGTCITKIKKTPTQDIIQERYPQKNLIMTAFIPGNSPVILNGNTYKQPDVEIQISTDDEQNSTILHTKYAYFVTKNEQGFLVDYIYETLDYIDAQFLLTENSEEEEETEE